MSDQKNLGRIEVSAQAISTIAAQAVLECYGVVGMASRAMRDGLAEILHRDNYHKGVDVRFTQDKIIIDLYVVIEYGTRISEVAHNIAGNVKFAVERAIGLPVAQVNVNVQGLRVSQ